MKMEFQILNLLLVVEILPKVSTHSLKAFMTTKCFIEYLHFIRDQFPGEKQIHLIIDSYSSHIAKASQMAATRLNIHLIYIPSGYTDKYQPLDVAVFAVLKSIANKKLRDFLYTHTSYNIILLLHMLLVIGTQA